MKTKLLKKIRKDATGRIVVRKKGKKYLLGIMTDGDNIFIPSNYFSSESEATRVMRIRQRKYIFEVIRRLKAKRKRESDRAWETCKMLSR